jgi:hypothetical protein
MGGIIRRLDLILARRAHQDVSLVYRQGDRVINLLSWTAKFLLRHDLITVHTSGIASRPMQVLFKPPAVRPSDFALMMPAIMRKTKVFDDFVDHVASRRQRIESMESMRTTLVHRPAMPVSAKLVQDTAMPEAHGVEMPVISPRRDSSAVDPPQQFAEVSALAHGDTRQIRGVNGKKAALSLGDYEVERIAERVIGSLDRRIVAQRERMGRN